jgi:hypothetical protein
MFAFSSLSQRTVTVILAVLALVFAYQTYTLFQLNAALASSDVKLGGAFAPPAVNLTTGGSAPAMVGGC